MDRAGTDWSWPPLHDAQRALLLDVLVHGSRSRADLARRAGLSRPSLSRLARDLVDLGFVSEGEAAPPQGRGRPSEILHIRPGSAQFAGFKLTGDALYGAVTDLHATELTSIELPLESREVDDVVALIGEVVDGFRAEHPRLSAVGVCLAGDVLHANGDSTVVGSHFLGWDDVPLERLVGTRTGLPTAVSNDVQALTVAHHWFGAGVGCRSLAVIGLGAGIGCGIVVDDQLIRGAKGHPAKVGHLTVTSDGPRCDRGHIGCASAYVTIPAIEHNAGIAGFAETLAAARAGSARADSALREAGRALGVVLADIVNLIDPEKIVVTGEGRDIAHYARDDVEESLRGHLDPSAEDVAWEVHDPFRFTDYAWAAAISAIRHVV